MEYLTMPDRLPATVSGNDPALIPEKTAGFVNETLLISTNQMLACPEQKRDLMCLIAVDEAHCISHW